jgi:hypothetical protein
MVVAVSVIICLGVTAIVIFLTMSFVRYPVQNTLRALLAILATAVGVQGIRGITGKIEVGASMLTLDSTGDRLIMVVLVLCTTYLAGVCLGRLPQA